MKSQKGDRVFGAQKKVSRVGRQAWRVSTLICRALRAKDENAAWKCVTVLHLRGTKEVFLAAADLCESSEVRKRRLGADILGQLGTPGRPFRSESLKIIHEMLGKEASAHVLNSILIAIGHCQRSRDNYGLKTISLLKDHSSQAVRFGVVMALLGRPDRISISTLMALSTDRSAQVRDWATFGLGTMVDLDTTTIHRALARRLGDSDRATRDEAIVGLARRKDPRVRAELVRELSRDNPSTLVFETAVEFGDRTLLSLIKPHAEAKSANGYWLGVVQDAYKALSTKKPVSP
jgi:HEAT repeat protein